MAQLVVSFILFLMLLQFVTDCNNFLGIFNIITHIYIYIYTNHLLNRDFLVPTCFQLIAFFSFTITYSLAWRLSRETGHIK